MRQLGDTAVKLNFLDRFRGPVITLPAGTRDQMRKAESGGLTGSVNQTVGWKKYFGSNGVIDQKLQAAKDKAAKALRRGISSVNAYYNIWGIYREGFDRFENDRLAQNPIYAICEKAVMDYFSTLDWTVQDGKQKDVKSAIKFLKRPNPQDTFGSMCRQVVRDIVRYDAGVIVLTRNVGGELVEMKAYHGPEFWIEIDHDQGVEEGERGQEYTGIWSHGYVSHYWQHSRPGVFIPFDPEEILYFMQYPRSDSPYGTDFLQNLKWYLEYLLDSTKAAGMTFANGVTPGLVWNHPNSTTSEQLNTRLKEIEMEHVGPDRFGGIIHTLGAEKIDVMSPTLVNMQWLQGQKFVSEIIWAMFGFSPSEFTSGDVNRATAYIQKNTTKSKVLYPMMRIFEDQINTKVLPFLPGYQDDWQFKFRESVDLDDDLKKAQVAETRARVFTSYVQVGLSPEIAIKLAGFGADMTPDLLQEIKEAEYQMQQVQQVGPGGDDDQQQGSDEAPMEGYGGTASSDAVQGQPMQKAIRKGKRGKRASEGNQRLDIFLHINS